MTLLKASATYQKKHYDVKGARVLSWVYDPVRKIGVCSKLINKLKVLCIIMTRTNYLVCLVENGRTRSRQRTALIGYKTHISEMD